MSLFKELSYDAAITPVKSIQFSLMSPDEIIKRSVVEIRSTETFSGNQQQANGMFDQRMGVVEHGKFCQTCHQGYTFCPGHIGHIKLATPVFHIHFFKTVISVLKCVCFKCGRLLIAPDHPDMKQIKRLHKQKRWDAVYKLISKNGTIKRCGQANPHGCGALQPSRTFKHDEKFLKIEREFSYPKDSGSDDHPPGSITMDASDVLKILERIPDEDIVAMGFNPKYSRPEWMIAQVLAVPPPAVRPSAKNEMGQRSEDDLTTVLINIFKANDSLLAKKTAGKPIENDPHLHLLQYYVATMVDNQIPNLSPATQRTGRNIKSISERLKGKEGRVRGNLLGKRVDYSARSVITPDPNISITELGVPLRIAMNLTFPEVVTEHNADKLRDIVARGPTEYPGARFVQKVGDNKRTIQLREGRQAPELANGDIVHRHVADGDYVLFNRQPSLHKMSMMAHRVRVMNHNTFRLNACVTPSFNADFDGDEMNMHACISPFSMCEIAMLAAVPMHILSPKNSSPIVAVVQDVALGVHAITLPDVKINKRLMHNLLSTLPAFDGIIPEPKDKSKREWTGKQALSAVIPAATNTDSVVHGEISDTAKPFRKEDYQAGTNGLVHTVYNELGPRAVVDMFDGTQRLVCDWLIEAGFSVGLSDLIVKPEITKDIVTELKSTEKAVSDLIKKIHSGKWRPKTSINTPHEEFESEVNRMLNSSRDTAAGIVTRNVSEDNRIMRMITAGSKGSDKNIVQMMATVGQQNVDNKRPTYGFEGRTLPHFYKYDDGAEARGFVRNSFATGLKPSEFLFHSMGGRVGLIDTAVRTSESGYISRKLVKAMEDCKVATDGTVRNSLGQIVQFMYGEDGMDTTSIEKQKLFHLNFDHERMADEFLIVPGDLDGSVVPEIKESLDKSKRWKRLEDHFKAIDEDRHNIIMYMYSGKKNVEKDTNVMFPVNVSRIISDAVAVQRLSIPRGWPSDLDPHHVLDELDSMVDLVGHPSMPQCPVFGAILRAHLSPKRLLREGITKETFDGIVSNIRERFDDSLAQPGDMVGIVSAQSLGEPTTQLTLNSVTSDTQVLVCQDGIMKNIEIGKLVDPYLPKIANPLHQNDYEEIDGLQCISISEHEKAKWSKVTHVSRHPSHNQCITIRTESGREVTATKGHSFLMRKNNGIVRVPGSELEIGDAMPIVKDLPEMSLEGVEIPQSPIPLTFNTGRFVGAVVSEGVVVTDKGRVNGAVLFDQNDESWVRSIVDGFNADVKLKAGKGDSYTYAKVMSQTDHSKTDNNTDVMYRGRINNVLFANWFKNNFGSTSYNKTLPEWILLAPKEFVRGVIQAMFDGDGSIPKSLQTISCYTVSDRLKTMYGLCMARFGIPVYNNVVYTNSVSNTKCRCHRISIPVSFAENFKTEIGITHYSKAERLDMIIDLQSTSARGMNKPIPVPEKTISEMISTARINNGLTPKLESSLYMAKKKESITPSLMQIYRSACMSWKNVSETLRSVIDQSVDADCYWDRITSIEQTDTAGQMVYDLTVEGDHTFFLSSQMMVGNTFHLAGVASASKAVSGLPRVMELLNVTSNPKKSFIYVHLPDDMKHSSEAAAHMKTRMETTMLSDVVSRSRIYYDPDDWDTKIPEDKELIDSYRVFAEECAAPESPWLLRFDCDKAAMLEHGVTMIDISDAINQFYRDSITCMHGDDNGSAVFRIRIAASGGSDLLTELRAFESAMLDSVTVGANMGIRNATPLQPLGVKEHQLDGATGQYSPVSESGEWVLETDGTDLSEILASPLVDSIRTHSNDICETLRVLGVEAARQKLFDELNEVLKDSSINPRHLLLLVDTMTLGGGLQSINRHGINRGEIGPLAKCSFEETTDMLRNAAMFAEVDRVNGVSASIMTGQVPPGGTGSVHPMLDESLLKDSVLVNHPIRETDEEGHVDREEMCRRILKFSPIVMDIDDGWNDQIPMVAVIVK